MLCVRGSFGSAGCVGLVSIYSSSSELTVVSGVVWSPKISMELSKVFDFEESSSFSKVVSSLVRFSAYSRLNLLISCMLQLTALENSATSLS